MNNILVRTPDFGVKNVRNWLLRDREDTTPVSGDQSVLFRTNLPAAGPVPPPWENMWPYSNPGLS